MHRINSREFLILNKAYMSNDHVTIDQFITTFMQ